LTSESRMIHLNQNGMESGHHDSSYMMTNGHMILGLQMAPKVPKVFMVLNLVNPMYSQKWVEAPQGVTMVQWVEEMVKSERQLVMSCIEVSST